MLREMYEQPEAIRRTLALYTVQGADGLELNPEFFTPLAQWGNAHGEVLILASGSSRHSGLAAEILLEDQCGLAVDVEYASEYSLRGGNPNSKDLRNPSVIVLSQSGETSDTLASLREARQRGQKTLAITNVEDSTMAREADLSMPLGAGRERAIPATKSFTSQLTVLALLALYEGVSLTLLKPEVLSQRLRELASVPDAIEAQLDGWETQMAVLANKYRDASTFLYLGRGIHYAIAREGALKLKEASYVHAEGYPAGELKHGPNALVSESVPLVVLATVDLADAGSVLRYEKTVQLLRDLKAQGAKVIALANAGDEEVAGLVSDCVFIKPAPEHLLPISEVIPLQMFAYFMAIEHGVNVDHPRNLAKAVIEAKHAQS
jgi:glucosamine--fructose-6-phosphate aminotransferase (isomerizing)